MSLFEAETLSEFVSLLKAEQGDSYDTLATKTEVSASTLHRIVNGNKADDVTLDKIAAYAGVTREWLYALAKGTQVRPRYSREVSLLIALLEDAPADLREEVLVVARALIGNRKKKPAKQSNASHNLAGG